MIEGQQIHKIDTDVRGTDEKQLEREFLFLSQRQAAPTVFLLDVLFGEIKRPCTS
jgi:hypothetical protein